MNTISTMSKVIPYHILSTTLLAMRTSPTAQFKFGILWLISCQEAEVQVFFMDFWLLEDVQNWGLGFGMKFWSANEVLVWGKATVVMQGFFVHFKHFKQGKIELQSPYFTLKL